MSSVSPVFFTSSILHVMRRLVLKGGGLKRVPLRVRIGYFYHPDLGHTLIDTGYSRHVVDGRSNDFLLGLYRLLLRPSIVTDAPLKSGLERLGLTVDDIDTVIVTHFHADHIGGLRDLPGAHIISSKAAWQSLKRNSRLTNALEGVFETLLPDNIQQRLSFFEDICAPTTPDGEFNLTRDGSVIAVDLPGHLEGQFGISFPQATPPFLYAADVQWSRDALVENRLPGFPANRIYHDHAAAISTVQKVRRFMQGGGDVLLCHDWHIHARDIDEDIGKGRQP